MGLILKPRVGLRPRWNNNPMAIPPPVACWVMNEGSGIYIYDLSGNGNQSAFFTHPSWVSGDINISNDAAEQITCGTNLEPQEHTLVCRLKWVAWQNGLGNAIFSVCNSILASGCEWVVGDDVEKKFKYAYYDGAIRGWYLSDTTLSLNTWYTLSGTWGSSLVSFYVDGLLDGSSVTPANAVVYNNDTVRIGWQINNAAFNGQIKYIYVYDSVLTAAQIAYIHQYPYYAWEYPELWELYEPCIIDPTMLYSRGDYAALPGGDANLETPFTCPEYPDVAADDNVYVQQTASDEYVLFLWKNQNDDNKSAIIVNWKGKSDRAPSISAVYLQIYNRNTPAWETLDSNNITGAGIEFTLSGVQIANLSYYYDGSNWVSCRVYQQAA